MERNIPILREKKSRSKGSKRLLVVLFLFFIILFIVLFFHSSLSKITIIEISGTSFTTETDIVQAAEVAEGDQFLAVSAANMSQRIKKLDAVADAEVRKTFPGKIEIIVEEHPHVANERLSDGQWAAILANGYAIEHLTVQSSPAHLDKPVLSGWQGEPELKKELTAALAALPVETLLDVSEILPSPSNSYPDRILLYTRSGHEVITTIEKLEEKLPFLTGVVHELRAKGTERARITMLEAITSEALETGLEAGEESGQP
ncbi:cell division protein DivIB [Xylanibacillus composti]|uniref:FtsQ-type POTRA domain-containing protein n=1 Tax=Xylanibacillus composti TaxID=1572762 RepID=A0A8J4M0Y4_9BACL|nr:FtsQ-type POTRA domain-containing protein [Xylanibacillus composti]MDT9724363.1 cell division protein DivIB [Xylanibacillus composti]GIQ67954.1 FtsQ-type POTRA domain-containing protein [Xylanibacillus composti]